MKASKKTIFNSFAGVVLGLLLTACGNPGDKLIDAVTGNRVGEAKSLIARGASVNTADADGNTVLMMAMYAADGASVNPAMVKMLIEQKANVNAKGGNNYTALHFAVMSGSVDCVRLVLKAGADPNVKDSDSLTPLAYAAGSGNFEMTRLLVKAGANVNAVDADGLSIMDNAVASDDVAVVKLLIDNGAKVKKEVLKSVKSEKMRHFLVD